jgi:amino acid permease
MPASQVTWIMVTGWFLSFSNNKRSDSHTSGIANTLIVATVILASVTFVYASKAIMQIPEHTNHPDHSRPMMPRFWQDGKACGEERGAFF